MKKYKFIFITILLVGCSNADDNEKPIYGKDSGLPVNCRAYIQVAIDDYKAHKYSADDALAGIVRNCGKSGNIWKENR